jgi:hypothetical protein
VVGVAVVVQEDVVAVVEGAEVRQVEDKEAAVALTYIMESIFRISLATSIQKSGVNSQHSYKLSPES